MSAYRLRFRGKIENEFTEAIFEGTLDECSKGLEYRVRQIVEHIQNGDMRPYLASAIFDTPILFVEDDQINSDLVDSRIYNDARLHFKIKEV